ncbi:MAG: MaoC/PaaZ C-terminal domain-containing protein [Janthinobacterium lividum]
MAMDPEALLARSFPVLRHAYTARDSIIYALGIGLGEDPLDAGQLRYVYEAGLQAVPSLANVLGYPGFWVQDADTGIDWRRVVHAEQSFVLHRTLPPAGVVVAQTRLVGLYDKGAEKGALLCQERVVRDEASGAALATVSQVSMLRGDGGRGGMMGAPPPPHVVPERPADATCDLPTLRQSALIYRLSGDLNPLHVEPAVAAAAGFPRPILHGMCTMGVACHAALRTLLDYDAGAFRGMRVRFTAPVLPGETIRTELWRDGDVVSFRSHVVERGVVVLNAGRIDVG